MLYSRSIPRTESVGAYPSARVPGIQLSWLTNPAITQAFVANPILPGSVDASIEFHGLPMSRPHSFGPFVVQRFQRTAIQHWVEEAEGGPTVGTVALINSGDHYKDLLLENSLATVPHAYNDARMLDVRPGARVFVHAHLATDTIRTYNVVDEKLAESLRLLESVPTVARLLETAASASTSIRYRTLPLRVVASFMPPSQISINRSLQVERPQSIAAVLAHELQHAAESHRGPFVKSEQDCIAAELRAVTTEAIVWRALVGSGGIVTATTPLERMENSRLTTVKAGEAATRSMVKNVWAVQCVHYR